MTKVLIVDDEPDIVDIIQILLKKKGYDAFAAYNAKQCFEILKNERPDIVLLDIMMPDVDGLEICNDIKNNDETRDIPVVMVTVKSAEEDIKKSFKEAMCDGYIIKPIIGAKILGTIEWVLKNHRETQPRDVIKEAL
jgi:two-component system, OmpR family, alkaline phosphatase synthesis response regulator PhoP